ncbi:diguanylate cyclase/phosphodiesterase with PAS/PAC and GAF sensor(s) [Anabaenopsis circularis NIES-21]|uniref:Diguanylate cyclase/phosphodiesterase with PAS/PAC and GAF sensor(S) n=1 Tax=Anabaenopsis circularis NIES-21 TaxID=1085406 RepID=A0A1Z4GMD5_9CYAN|nr:diguanylate cyclase/phosphodiesterase with PAS/PAC and GAF sensor(s) [Anabaenopsis circularis NIES-21]
MTIHHLQSRYQSSSLHALCQFYSQKTSIAVVLIGCVVLMGWMKDITVLKSVVPGWVAMKVNTAICLILGGTSLWLWHWQWKPYITRSAAQVCAFLVLVISLLTLMQYAFNLDFGIDQILFKTSIDPLGDVAPGRMAVHTAVIFLLLGLSLLLLSLAQPKYFLAQSFALVAFFIASMGLLGYVYGNAYFYKFGSLTSIAIHTAVALILLICGILFACPNRGLMIVVTSKHAGGMMARNLLPAAIIFPPAICWLVLCGYRMEIYTAEFGLCILSVLNIIVFAVLIWRNARSLNVIDHQRRRSQIALQKANEELEERVILRTNELLRALEQLQAEIGERQIIEQALFQEKELALVTLQSIGDGVITTDARGLIKYINPVAEILTGWSLSEAMGMPLTQVFQIIHENTREAAENPVEQVLDSGMIVALANHTVLITRNGRELSIEDSAAPIRTRDGDIVGVVLVFHDVTQSRNMARLLSWQAKHDSLTGLVNRREFEHRLAQAVTNAHTGTEQHALCYLDLDQFKVINDTCGHIAGDELLCEIANLFQSHIPSCETLARLGGDEFGIIFNNCSLEAAVVRANIIRENTQKFRFVWKQDKVFNISISIGLVAINADTPNMNSALSAADAACYVAKNQGRNRVHIYQADDLELARQYGEMQWVGRITQALEDNRFRLYYQSIVPVTRNHCETEHYEILLRLIDETGKLVSPMAFIPAAERYNLMQTIDRWVIHTFFTHLGQCVDFQQHYCPLLKYSRGCLYTINLSGASINDEQFIDFICDQFTLHQIPPAAICFEITETVAIKNLGKAAGFIRALKDFGCCFALDDFGSGMSSFAYLKNLPVDYLKIDGSFVKHIVEEPIDLAMVDAINKIGQVMGIQTIAEFVENNDILKVIQNLGVNYAQGYGVGRPTPFKLFQFN